MLTSNLQEYQSLINCCDPKVGTISADQTAIVGDNSWIFLYKGSNSYYEAYLQPDHANLAKQWLHLINHRHLRLSDGGIKFVQIILPNKASILGDFYPLSLPTSVTYILSGILESSASKALCPLHEWRDPLIKDSIFRRNDSHLTVAGNAHLTKLILSSIGLPLLHEQYMETSITQHIGDLGSKFSPSIPELFHAPSFSSGMLDQSRIEKTYEHIPNSGFNGIRQSFFNSTPAYDLSVLIFGNSFFERCPSWGLSPIFSALFRETHFSWSSDVDYSLVDAISPDIVIAQTCERFLCKVPSH